MYLRHCNRYWVTGVGFLASGAASDAAPLLSLALQRKSLTFGTLRAIEIQMEVGGSGVPDEGGFPVSLGSTVIRDTVRPLPGLVAAPEPTPAAVRLHPNQPLSKAAAKYGASRRQWRCGALVPIRL